MKKRQTTIIISLFLSLLITTTITSSESADLIKQKIIQTNKSETLYVGGDGPQNYSRIQDAVDNANAGDVIYVYNLSSPYYENIIITKNNIQLIGQDKFSTIIDGNGMSHVIKINADYVTIKGFTIQNSGSIDYPDYDAGLYLLYPSDHNNIINNIVINNLNGICLQASKNNTLSGNIVSNNVKGFLIISDSVFNNIFSNNVENNNYGFYTSFTVYNNITENNIANSSEYGMYFYFVRLCKIKKNNFMNNTIHVYFIERLRLAFNRNCWTKNYWDTWIGFGPKVLKGQMFTEWVGQKLVPWVNLDWFPASKPYTYVI
jgi:parallel beta-helix repeat protein